jgi:NAD(P)H dehydrogenase (quinone)
MDLIIYAHPAYENGHNSAILRFVQDSLRRKGKSFQTIDLYKEKFDPVLRLVDESAGVAGYSDDVKRYQKMISDAEKLIFIYPIWWYNMPAMMKGFIDRTFTSGFAFDYSIENGRSRIKPRLSGKNAVVINTFGHGEKMFKEGGSPAIEVLDKVVLRPCGMKTRRVNWFDVMQHREIPQEIKDKIEKALV